MTTPEDDKSRTEYLSLRTGAVSAGIEEQRTLDKYLLTLVPGSLVLSFTAITDGFPSDVNSEFLFLAWFSFVLCIVLVLLSMTFSSKAWRAHVEILDLMYEDEDSCAAKADLKKWGDITGRLNTGAIVFCVAGFAFFALFAGLNLHHREEATMSAENPTAVEAGSPRPEPPGSVPPGAPKPRPGPKPKP